MKPTDKRFWIAWIVVELLMLSSCIYMVVQSKVLEILSVFVIGQPLMGVLALYKKHHPDGALANLIFACIYSSYALYINITGEDGNGWGWVFFMIVLPIIQLIILLLFWGIQKIAETNEPKE